MPLTTMYFKESLDYSHGSNRSNSESGEMAWKLKALAVHIEDMSFVPSTHFMVGHLMPTCNCNDKEYDDFSWALKAPTHKYTH